LDKSRNIILWGGWYGSRNVGDQLLLLSITDLIEKYLPGQLTYYALTSDATWIDEYTSNESACSIKGIQSRQELIKVITLIKNCDLFVFGGGVPFFDQPKQVLVMLFLVLWLRLFRKPYMTWAVSSQCIQKWYSKLVYGWVLKGASLLTCRDKFTPSEFKKIAGEALQVHLVADSVFSLEYNLDKGVQILKRAGWKRDERPLVALTPRTLRMPDGESETHYRLHRDDEYSLELASFSAALDWLWEQGYQPVFIPMNTVAPDDDLQAAREIMEQARYGQQALVIDEILRPREVQGIYALCQLSYVARVHGSISSFLVNTPMMMYAFASKHRGVMEIMGMEEYALSEEGVSVENTLAKLKNLINNREKIRKALTQKKEELEQNAQMTAELMLEHIFGL
jgi:polysaccharide pyruvyl transferase WcaK-like protein